MVGISLIGGAVSANQASKAASNARNAQGDAQRALNAVLKRRGTIVNPYSGVTDLTSLATDLSKGIGNAFANLGVATSAAEIQMEQADIALANTLDTLRATGASAGGATALAQAALQSKKGVAANIEQQEAQNEKLRAQGEQQLQQLKMSEQQRLQGIAISEGQRLQTADAAGKSFTFQANEQRINADLGRAAGMQQQAQQNYYDAKAGEAGAWASTITAIGTIGAASVGNKTPSTKTSYKKYKSSNTVNKKDWSNIVNNQTKTDWGDS